MTRLWKEMQFTIIVGRTVKSIRYGMDYWDDELDLEDEIELMHDLTEALEIGGVVEALCINGRKVELYDPAPNGAWLLH